MLFSSLKCFQLSLEKRVQINVAWSYRTVKSFGAVLLFVSAMCMVEKSQKSDQVKVISAGKISSFSFSNKFSTEASI